MCEQKVLREGATEGGANSGSDEPADNTPPTNSRTRGGGGLWAGGGCLPGRSDKVEISSGAKIRTSNKLWRDKKPRKKTKKKKRASSGNLPGTWSNGRCNCQKERAQEGSGCGIEMHSF